MKKHMLMSVFLTKRAFIDFNKYDWFLNDNPLSSKSLSLKLLFWLYSFKKLAFLFYHRFCCSWYWFNCFLNACIFGFGASMWIGNSKWLKSLTRSFITLFLIRLFNYWNFISSILSRKPNITYNEYLDFLNLTKVEFLFVNDGTPPKKNFSFSSYFFSSAIFYNW